MAHPQYIIDSVVSYHDDLGTGEAPAADLTRRRARILNALQFVYELVWNFREWSWTYKESAAFTIASGANSTAAITTIMADFLNFGREGHLYDTDRKIRLDEKARYLVEALRRESSSSVNSRIFAIFDGKIQIPYTAPSTLNLIAFHRKKAETLADNSTEMVIPDPYADTVLLPGAIWRSQESKRDIRETWKAQFQEGLRQMCELENPGLSAPQKMPLANRGW